MEYENENEIREEIPVTEPAEETAPRTALTALSAKKRAPRLKDEAQTGTEKPSEAPDPNERVPVCDVQFRPGSKIYFFDPAGLELKNGDHGVIDTSRGAEYGICVIGSHRIARRELVQPLRKVLRVATPVDERIKAENEKKEKDAYAFCLQKIEELGLDMQLVSVECAFDGSKLLFFFTADARVDFRELVKILAYNYHTRIELRQIGVRDKAKMLGGLGICGRPFCCASFLDDFQPVSIKMAKTQNLSLNPTKISGTCGRLMCCLKYEQEAYEHLIKTMPKVDAPVDTPDGRGTVTDVNLMHQTVSVRMEQDEDEIRSYRNEEICILRSGKAKKNDPPIPPDLAPISGRKDGELLRERRPFLDHRLTVDPDELEEAEQPGEDLPAEGSAPEQPQENASRRSHRDRKGKPGQTERPEQGDQPAPETAQAQKPEQEKKPSESGKKKKNRRGGKPAEQTEKTPRPEQPERIEKAEGSGKQKPSRQQRRRQQQGRSEAKLPQAEQPKRPVPEKAGQAEQPAPKPEGKKNNKRRYYHNRKPKG